MNESAQRAAVVAEAMTWCGTPYHHHGRVKQVGVDCLMLLAEVFERVGLVPRIEPGNYARQWHLHRSEELYANGLTRYCIRRPDHSPWRPGDVVLYRFGRCFSHGGVVVDGGRLLHAYIGSGVVLTRPNESPLAGRTHQLWSLWP